MKKIFIILLLLLIIVAIVNFIFSDVSKINKNTVSGSTNESTSVSESSSTSSLVPVIIGTKVSTSEEKTAEVTDESKINKIIEESNLNVLLQVKTFDSLNVNYEPLLEAAMRIASNSGYLESSTKDGAYVEYVPRTVINDIIYELFAVKVTDPIQIDDFYYLYDEAGDYYYVVPVGVNWISLDKVQSIVCSSSDTYTIKCSGMADGSEYGYSFSYPNIEVKLKYKPAGKYVKYQLISISAGRSEEISDF